MSSLNRGFMKTLTFDQSLDAACARGSVDFQRGQSHMNRLLNWFRRDDLEKDLDRELRYRVDRRVSNLMRSGLSERQAKRRATLEPGGVAQVQEKYETCG
jgi:hypothetical protein